MVLRWLKAVWRCMKAFVRDLHKACQGYAPCDNEECEQYVRVDEPNYPWCLRCYGQHYYDDYDSAEDLTEYVMDQYMRGELEEPRRR